MADRDKMKRAAAGQEKLSLDYENIDVAEIMAQVKERIASRAREAPSEKSRDISEGVYQGIPVEPGLPPGTGSGPRKILLKLMRPFAPLIKLAILPVYQELRETIEILDHANRRLDALSLHVYQEVSAAIEQVNLKLDQSNQALNRRLDLAFGQLDPTLEYTKLLHNLAHNIVVELTKLKIEEENLKLKARILEKDFEFLEKREKELEKQVFS